MLCRHVTVLAKKLILNNVLLFNTHTNHCFLLLTQCVLDSVVVIDVYINSVRLNRTMKTY